MAIQTSYPDNIPAAVAGLQATMIDGIHISRTVEEANIGFGVAVTQGTGDKGITAFGTGDTTFVGITLLDRSATGRNATTGAVTADTFGVGESARVLAVGSGGDVWVQASVAVNAGDPVFVIPATGAFTKSNASSAVQIPGARWDTSTAGAGLAVVRLA